VPASRSRPQSDSVCDDLGLSLETLRNWVPGPRGGLLKKARASLLQGRIHRFIAGELETFEVRTDVLGT
jgi:hypothetical protein